MEAVFPSTLATSCLDADIGRVSALLPSKSVLLVEPTDTVAAVCCALCERQLHDCLVRLPDGAYRIFDLAGLHRTLLLALWADTSALRVISVLGASSIEDVLNMYCGETHALKLVSPNTHFSEVLDHLLMSHIGGCSCHHMWTPVLVGEDGDDTAIARVFTCSDVLQLLIHCIRRDSCPALQEPAQSLLGEAFMAVPPRTVAADIPLQSAFDDLWTANSDGVVVLDDTNPELPLLRRALGSINVADVQYLFIIPPPEAALRLAAPCHDFVAFELEERASPRTGSNGNASDPFPHVDADQSCAAVASKLLVSRASCIALCSLERAELNRMVCARDIVSAFFVGGHFNDLTLDFGLLEFPLSIRNQALPALRTMSAHPPFDLNGSKRRRVTWADDNGTSTALASVLCFEAEERLPHRRSIQPVLALEDTHCEGGAADVNMMRLPGLRSVAAGPSTTPAASVVPGMSIDERTIFPDAVCSASRSVSSPFGSDCGEVSDLSDTVFNAVKSLTSSPKGDQWNKEGQHNLAKCGEGVAPPSGYSNNMQSVSSKKSQSQEYNFTGPAVTGSLVCSSLGVSLGIGEELQVVLYSEHNLVLFDARDHRAFARSLTEEQANAITRFKQSSCPLCHQRLSASWSFLVEGYFAMLHETIPQEVASFAASQTANKAAVCLGLHNISARLFNCGYYSRFFVEERKLGSGSFGAVYVCRHVMDEIDLGVFAVKQIALGDDTKRLRQLMREVKALERLRNMNVVDYKHSWLEVSRHSEMCPFVPFLFILMEYCNAGSLEGTIWPDGFVRGASDNAAKANMLNDALLWSIFLDICRGLRHLHSQCILHFDLKPSNILLHNDEICVDQALGRHSERMPRAVLSDFGSCNIQGDASCNVSGARIQGGCAVEFMAPERLRGQDGDAPADMWSAGIVLYAMCFGDLPFHSDNPEICREKVLQHREPIDPQTAGSADCNSTARDLVAALTARDPVSRPTAEAAERISAAAARSVNIARFGGPHDASIKEPDAVAVASSSPVLLSAPVPAASRMG
eukprot:TRINITY_DN49520_c0_g1_i1.p1 TRINITY_DN49520_c0_g1~~TRINITY_DN49520_c0_g1_i1.p1  ORF type:complete len:1046 (-),score=153.82 TRINITY_DN49520_c0_g1_i1:507-3602(-)